MIDLSCNDVSEQDAFVQCKLKIATKNAYGMFCCKGNIFFCIPEVMRIPRRYVVTTSINTHSCPATSLHEQVWEKTVGPLLNAYHKLWDKPLIYRGVKSIKKFLLMTNVEYCAFEEAFGILKIITSMTCLLKTSAVSFAPTNWSNQSTSMCSILRCWKKNSQRPGHLYANLD